MLDFPAISNFTLDELEAEMSGGAGDYSMTAHRSVIAITVPSTLAR